MYISWRRQSLYDTVNYMSILLYLSPVKCRMFNLVVSIFVLGNLAASLVRPASCEKTNLGANTTIVSSRDAVEFRNNKLHHEDRTSLYNQANYEKSKKLSCGQQFDTRDSRIVGGKVTSISEFPWMVSLQREKAFWFGFKAYYHSCGGSLLTPSWIITASHCLYQRNEPLRAVAGTDNLNQVQHAQVRNVVKIIAHPQFEIESYNNDIALLKVNPPFDFDSSHSRVSPICFERDVEVEPYDIATICGFGAKAFRQRARTHLYKTDIAIIDSFTCNRSFDDSITENMICAGGMIARKRDACSGDSGGPLQIDIDGHQSLIGLVSFGNDCAVQGYPGVYTKLRRYYDWVLSFLDEPLIDP